MAALFDLVEVSDVRVGVLNPAARSPENSPGNVVKPTGSDTGAGAWPAARAVGSSAFPVRPGRRGPGARQPVQGDVVEDVVPGEVARRLLVEEGAGDLVVTVRVVVIIQAARATGESSRA